MAFLNAIINILKNLFSVKNSDTGYMGTLKNIENELKSLQPQLYKNGFLTPNLAELLHILYVESKELFNLFSETIASDDSQKITKYTDMLISTGFYAESRDLWNSISYDERKKELEESGENHKLYEEQHRRLEKILHQLDSDEFVRIEKVIREIDRLVDICRFNYISVLHQFDPSFSSDNPSRIPEFRPVLLADIEHTLMDIYYIASSLDIKVSEARAVISLAELQKGSSLSEEETNKIMQSLKKINAVFRNILTKSTLQKMIFLSKNTTEFQPQTAQYTRKLIQPFKERIRKQFDADTKRIISEFQDLRIKKELMELFGPRELLPLHGYSHETNDFLQRNSTESFQYITPMQILKTFIHIYFIDQIISLLNDIVVEGFFSNPLYKTEFAASVFACGECRNRITEFEKTFEKNGENDIYLLKSYTNEGLQNTELLKKMSQMIDNANRQARNLIETQANYFNDLYNKIAALISESKKSSTTDISNIKMLITSTRNKDNADLLEKQYSKWRIFLDIMQNYVIIASIEKKNT